VCGASGRLRARGLSAAMQPLVVVVTLVVGSYTDVLAPACPCRDKGRTSQRLPLHELPWPFLLLVLTNQT
jgi:hypothetical protein